MTLPRATTRERKMWVVMAYLDGSGTKVFNTKQEATDFAVQSANDLRCAVWVYEADARIEAAPTQASISAFPNTSAGEPNG
jgi:hypothetical protein